jgi:N-acetylated-alpha-linked acidic dipeptidase
VDGYEKGASDQDKKRAKKAAEGGDLPISALGSGSDYSPFLQHLGLHALNIEYGGEDDQGGVYHSRYDTFEHYVRFGDPQFAYGVAEAETIGRAVLRMANADVLPMQFAALATTIGDYTDELHKLADDKRKKSEELQKLIGKNAFQLAADPTRVVHAPEREPEVPYLSFAALDNSVARLKKSAQAYDDACEKVFSGTPSLAPAQRKELNAQLRGIEQTLTNSNGLPGRPWYRHLIYAPGLLTGYGVKTLPGVREAIEDNRWNEANQYVVLTAQALDAYSDRLDKATALLKP